MRPGARRSSMPPSTPASASSSSAPWSAVRPGGRWRRSEAAGLAEMAPPPCSLVVVSWESRLDLARLVDSMLEHLDQRHELVLADNASSDEPERELERWPGPVRFQRLAANRGFGTAANAGVAEASNEGVVVINPDVELRDGRLADLAEAALGWGALAGP